MVLPKWGLKEVIEHLDFYQTFVLFLADVRANVP